MIAVKRSYRTVCGLKWALQKLQKGKMVKIYGFAKDSEVRLFRVVLPPKRTEYVATKDTACDLARGAQQACAGRWEIEEFHPEVKQLTGAKKCRCRKGRLERNHIASALLVWTRFKSLACESGKTDYQLKHGLLYDFIVQQLESRFIKMALA